MNTIRRPAEPPVFRGFDPKAEVEIRERNLPHWFQPGAATFVTFRTADSMPSRVILRWQRELEEWLAARNLPVQLAESIVQRKLANHEELPDVLSAAESREFKRLTHRIFHRTLDECHGACLLKRPELAAIVGDAIRYYHGRKYDLDRFVVMPNHVHCDRAVSRRCESRNNQPKLDAFYSTPNQ